MLLIGVAGANALARERVAKAMKAAQGHGGGAQCASGSDEPSGADALELARGWDHVLDHGGGACCHFYSKIS